MSNSSHSDTSSDPTDDESSSTQQSTTQNSENKQTKTQENNSKDSEEETSESESESDQDSTKKAETKQVTPPENNKESSETNSTQTESSQNSTKKSVKQEQAQKNESSPKKQSDASSSKNESEEESDEENSSSEEETSEPMDASSSTPKTDQKSKSSQKKSSEKNEKVSKKEDKKKSSENQNEKKQSSDNKPKTRDVQVDESNNNENNNPPPNSSNDNENDGRKMDRYGWYVDKKKISKQEQQLIQIENQKESERTQKWLDMTKNWSSFMKKNRNKVAERIKKGIPDQMRSRAWALLCQAEQMKKQYPTPMSELLERPRHQGYATIDKDLVRTFPQIGFFAKTGFLESLRRILYCYCQTDPVLGYTQGMSFIAGMFLSYMDEETAYYSFLNVMLGKRLNQRGYFLAGFPRLDKANLMLGCLMEKKCPKILKKMDSLGVIMSMFTPGWFLTVYQSYTWQPEFQLRIFERYLFYGTRALLNFGIVIILYHQKILEKAGMEEFLKILQHPDTSEKMMNWHSVLQDWDKNWLNKAEYEKLLTRCGVQKESESY